jgi:predicted alpha/beta hydrolase family esterase
MKIADAELLIIPGLGNASPFDWQGRWLERMSTARRVEQADWKRPRREAWCANLVAAVEAAQKPVILIAHSVGVLTVAHAAGQLDREKIAGAFLVGVSDWERPEMAKKYGDHGFAPVPRTPLGFPALLLASSNDPTCEQSRAEGWAADWGARFGDAGAAGHFDAASGHGPWPEGLMAFAKFTASLG